MTFKYNNVFINDVSTITGPYEKNGPLSKYFDKSFDDFYMGTKNFEEAETKLVLESIEKLLGKLNKNKKDIDLFIAGDLSNQIIASSFAAKELEVPYLGIFSACASSVEGLIIASNMIDNNQINNCLCSVSGHNNSAERQFRYPIEYGAPKRKTTTFTVTGAASAFLSKEKGIVKVESGTIGSVVDLGVKDVYSMGAVMAPACAKTLYKHLKETGRSIDYYDLVLSGDLGKYGKSILKDYMKIEYDIELDNYDDTACMIYDLENQKVYSGGSGPACAPLVTYSYIFDCMKKKKVKKVLLLATGALLSTTSVNEKRSIPAIAHAISLEVS